MTACKWQRNTREATVRRDGDAIVIDIPMDLRRRSGRKEIVLPPDAEKEPKAHQNRPLVLALARAHKWQKMLDSGEASGMEAIAAQHGVDRAYVSRILGLAMLAPNLTEAALQGDEPGGLSLRRLTKGLPSRWDEQRETLGFPLT